MSPVNGVEGRDNNALEQNYFPMDDYDRRVPCGQCSGMLLGRADHSGRHRGLRSLVQRTDDPDGCNAARRAGVGLAPSTIGSLPGPAGPVWSTGKWVSLCGAAERQTPGTRQHASRHWGGFPSRDGCPAGRRAFFGTYALQRINPFPPRRTGQIFSENWHAIRSRRQCPHKFL